MALLNRWWGRLRRWVRRGSHRNTAAAYPMTAREFEALRGIARKGGAVSVAWIAARLGVSSEYVRMLCAALVRDDVVDVTPEGCYVLTPRGKRALHERGVRMGWSPEELEILPPEVRKQLAHELADAIKQEVGGALGSLVGALPRERAEAARAAGVAIRTDYTFPQETVALEHTLEDRAEREVTAHADRIEEAAEALGRIGRKHT